MKSPSISAAIFSLLGSACLVWFFSTFLLSGKDKLNNTIDAEKAYEIVLSPKNDINNIKEKAKVLQDYTFLKSISTPLWKFVELSYLIIVVFVSFPWILFLFLRFKRKKAEQGAAANP